ncbi:rhodanese-like domain-containing protein [Labilibaculum sp.]|uniref:rhodanese-like domain-containing protein n=1 Tax=Labilibaculum sp. TaxID=2060723 RepID=UPI003568298A
MKTLFLFILLFFSLSITAVFSQSDSLQILSVEHFNRVLHLNSNAELIDVSSAKEFKKAHIFGAYSAPTAKDLYQIIDSLGTSKVYLLYCKYGDRSVDAGKMIFEKYHIPVCSLEDGLDAWLQAGKEVEN